MGKREPVLKRRSEYLNELRQEPRWVDRRITISKIGGGEYPGVTGDVSLHGLRLALVGVSIPPDLTIEVDIAYEEALVSLRGQIKYSVDMSWGCIVGVASEPVDPTAEEFLSGRYGQLGGAEVWAAAEAPRGLGPAGE